MNRKEFIAKYQATFIMDFDCIDWFYKTHQACKSMLPARVLNFLLNEQDGKDDDTYLLVNCSYIANRIGNSRSRIQEALEVLAQDNLILKQTQIGANGWTKAKLNWPKIVWIQEIYQSSLEYKKWHKDSPSISDLDIIKQSAEELNQTILKNN